MHFKNYTNLTLLKKDFEILVYKQEKLSLDGLVTCALSHKANAIYIQSLFVFEIIFFYSIFES